MGNTRAILRASDSTTPKLDDLQVDELYYVRNTKALYSRANSEVVNLVRGGAGVSIKNVNEVISNYTAVDSDNVIICDGTFTVTLMTASANLGLELNIKNIGTGTITIEGDGSETIDGVASFNIEENDCLTVVSDGTNWIIINFYNETI